MTAQTPSSPRPFRVHARHIERHHAHRVLETSFEAAAVAYLEDHAHGLADDGGDALSLIVLDLTSGHEQCFRVDLATGEAAPCG
jgi:hypothetical protein